MSADYLSHVGLRMKKKHCKHTITRQHLSSSIKESTGISGKDSLDIVEQILRNMIDAIKIGKIVKIRMFGTFITRHKRSRMGRNPKTMEESIISERTVVRMRVAPTLKKMINNNIKMIKKDAG